MLLSASAGDRELRALPALMKLLGHVNPEMTMRYIDVAGTDLQRFLSPIATAAPAVAVGLQP